jgi:hypothetical protein
MGVDDGDDFFALLVFVARVANAVATLFGHRVGAIAMQMLRSSGLCADRCATLATKACSREPSSDQRAKTL